MKNIKIIRIIKSHCCFGKRKKHAHALVGRTTGKWQSSLKSVGDLWLIFIVLLFFSSENLSKRRSYQSKQSHHFQGGTVLPWLSCTARTNAPNHCSGRNPPPLANISSHPCQPSQSSNFIQHPQHDSCTKVKPGNPGSVLADPLTMTTARPFLS